MYIKCIVCRNSFKKTMFTRPELIYHRFPSDADFRKKWCEVLGVDHGAKWHRVCSDHFLKENYVPGINRRLLHRKTIPQPYDKKCDQNGFPNKKKYTVVKQSTGTWSSRKIKSTRTKNDKNYKCLPRLKVKLFKKQIPKVIKTNVKSMLTATQDAEPYCSVPGCMTNTEAVEAKEITLFAPPMEYVNAWSLALGFQLTVNSIVCEHHFRPNDMLYPELLINGSQQVVKSLVTYALPKPINDGRSA